MMDRAPLHATLLKLPHMDELWGRISGDKSSYRNLRIAGIPFTVLHSCRYLMNNLSINFEFNNMKKMSRNKIPVNRIREMQWNQINQYIIM